MASLINSLFLLAAATGLASATSSASAAEACTKLKSMLPNGLALPDEPSYTKENRDYYNVGLADLKPACIVFPNSAEEVSSVVKVLHDFPEVRFAVKSGGHSPNAGHSSVKDGVLIALREIKGTQLDKEKGVAYVKPGGHWWDVIKALDGTGQAVVGGRLGVVGIGGFLLQGGVSFLSGQYGLAADNIIEYETVVANGSIVRIHQDSYPELVKAMRGGGSQFGIVTKFTLRTYPVDKLWTGIRTYNCTRKEWSEALQDFVANLNNYPKSATLIPIGSGIMTMGSRGISGAFQDIAAAFPQSNNGGSGSSGSFGGLGSLGSLLSLTGSTGSSSSSGLGSLAGLFGSSSGRGSRNTNGVGGKGRKSTFKREEASRGSTEVDLLANDIRITNQIQEYLRLLGLYHFAEQAPPSATSAGSCYVPLLYDGQQPPKEAWGKKFNSFPLTGEYGDFVNYKSIIGISDALWQVWTLKTAFRSLTLPVQPDNPNYIAQIEDIFNEIGAQYSKKLSGPGGQTLVFQPFPKIFGKHADSHGGNAMGLTGSDHDRFVLEIASIFTNKADEAVIQEWGKAFTDKLTENLKTSIANAKSKNVAIGEYNPFFMNDSGPDQDCIASYKDMAKFALLQKELDPKGFFSKRGGGYKFP